MSSGWGWVDPLLYAKHKETNRMAKALKPLNKKEREIVRKAIEKVHGKGTARTWGNHDGAW